MRCLFSFVHHKSSVKVSVFVADVGSAVSLLAQIRSKFKVVSVILLGMAEGLKKDQFVILRMDGEDLNEFINSPDFEPETVSLFSEIDLPAGSFLRDYMVKALEKLTVDQGMPPASDSWVMSSIVQPALQFCDDQQQLSQETFLAEFKRVAEIVAKKLSEQHVIVAHHEKIFDGSGIKRLLSNKFELDKAVEAALQNVPKEGKTPKEYMQLVLDVLAPSAILPPFGALDEMDRVIKEELKMLDGDGNIIEEDEFQKQLVDILHSIMLQLEDKPISASTNSVVHELLTKASSLLHTSSS